MKWRFNDSKSIIHAIVLDFDVGVWGFYSENEDGD